MTHRIARAIAKLASLRDDAPLGVSEVVACGPAAIPALRKLLFDREPSGLYEPRRRAVEALAELKAYDVLAEYLTIPRMITDPVEETGEEAVINAAARALADWSSPKALPLLTSLTRRAPLVGVVDALAKLHCVEAIPYFITALAEDFTRPSAEAALRSFGAEAAPALLEAACLRFPLGRPESVSSLRSRRSALALLAEIGPGPNIQSSVIETFLDEQDSALAILGCRIMLASGSLAAAPAAIKRLISLLPDTDILLRLEIEDCLVAHFPVARPYIAEALDQAGTSSEETQLTRALRHMLKHAFSD